MEPMNLPGELRSKSYALTLGRVDGGRASYVKSIRVEQAGVIAMSFNYCTDVSEALKFCKRGAAFAIVAAIAHHGETALEVVEV